MSDCVKGALLVCAFLCAVCDANEEVRPKSAGENKQLLVVAPGYWRAGDAAKFSFEVYDLGEGGKRIHRADPGKVGEIRGMCLSPATQRLYVSGHEGLLCYDWPGRKLLWRAPVEGAKANQNDAITVNVDGARLYTIRHFGRGLNVYDANDGKRLRVIHENEKHAWGRFSQVSHDGRRLYASKCDGGGGEVFIIDTADDTMVGRFKPVLEPLRFALTPDGRRFVYATGAKRTLAVNSAADGKLLHEIAVPAWEGAIVDKAPVAWMALSPDGSQAWACDVKNSVLHRFDLAAEPPRYAGRAAVEAGTEGLMFSVDGRSLVTGRGAILLPADGKPVGHLSDENGRPCQASNSMMALEVDAATGRIVRTNQQCAPAWPGPRAAKDGSTQ
jgi:sugar lactone lactonase YvrE